MFGFFLSKKISHDALVLLVCDYSVQPKCKPDLDLLDICRWQMSSMVWYILEKSDIWLQHRLTSDSFTSFSRHYRLYCCLFSLLLSPSWHSPALIISVLTSITCRLFIDGLICQICMTQLCCSNNSCSLSSTVMQCDRSYYNVSLRECYTFKSCAIFGAVQ